VEKGMGERTEAFLVLRYLLANAWLAAYAARMSNIP